MRVLGFALAAALTALAWTAAGASALPEFGRCLRSATHEGRYTDANCTTKAKKVGEKFTGEYEWHKSTTFAERGERTEIASSTANTPEHFRPSAITTIAASFVKCAPNEEEKVAKCKEGETEERVPIDITCKNVGEAGQEIDGSMSGQFSTKSAKEIDRIHFRLFDCEAMGVECANSIGQFAPEINTDRLKAVLGYIKKGEPKEVGIDYKPENGDEIAKFSCGGAMNIILGGAKEQEGPAHPPKGGGAGVIAPVTPINEMLGGEGEATEGVTQVLTLNESDENVPSSFEGKALQALESWFYNPELLGKGSKWSAAGLVGGFKMNSPSGRLVAGEEIKA
jgi:hypothetical protein